MSNGPWLCQRCGGVRVAIGYIGDVIGPPCVCGPAMPFAPTPQPKTTAYPMTPEEFRRIVREEIERAMKEKRDDSDQS